MIETTTAGPFAPRPRHRNRPRLRTLARRLGRSRRSTNLPLLAPRDRHQPQADRSEQPHPEAVTLPPGLSPLPRSGAPGPLSVDSRSPVAAVSLRPKPEEAPPPIPFRFALWFRRGLRLRAFTVTVSHCFAGRTSARSCRSWCRFRGVARLPVAADLTGDRALVPGSR